MNSLEEENAKLRAENDRLKKAIIRISKDGGGGVICTVYLDTIRYDEKVKPKMHINNSIIDFDSSNDKTAQLAKVICRKENLMTLKNTPVTTDEIYDWYKYSEDWFNISPKERRQFQKNLYQWFRRLNEKLLPCLGNNKLFEKIDGKYGFNRRIRIISSNQQK